MGTFEAGTQEAAIRNVQLTTDPGVQQFPSIAVNPLDSEHLVVVYMDYSLVDTGYAGLGVAVSFDGGATWDYSQVPVPEPFDQGAANPNIRFDDQGRVFVTYMAATFREELPPLTSPNFLDRWRGAFSDNGIFVARSDDGGLTWNEPVAVASNLYDGQNPVNFEAKPDLAIDTFEFLPDGTANPHYGNVYVVWTRLYAPGEFPGEPDATGGGEVMIAVSHDGGLTWDIRQHERDGALFSAIDYWINFGIGAPLGLTFVDQAHVVVGPEGGVYVSSFAGGRFAVHYSADGAQVFDAPDFATGSRFAFDPDDFIQMGPEGLPNNQFRTATVRAIAADPTHPGQAYIVEPMWIFDAHGTRVDAADVFFAVSSDYGETWQTSFTAGGVLTNILNDDNDAVSATGFGTDEVIAGQALPRLAVDADGNIGVIWYDTRRDPDNRLLDVFGTFSTDGGLTFSPNFRITTVSFDANLGVFTGADGSDQFYIGDAIGLAMADNVAYAVWTDTRHGNQDIFFARLTISPAPEPPNDRFEDNDSPATATQLGANVHRVLPKLSLPAGDEDWFAVEAVSTGELIVTADQAAAGERLRLELWSADGTLRLATGDDVLDDAGQITGARVVFAAAAGERFLVRVLPVGEGVERYSLEIQSLTADLGTRVQGVVEGVLQPGDEAYYLLRVPAAGSLEAALSVTGDVRLEILDRQDLSVLAAGPAVSVPVLAGQSVLLRVTGVGGFELSFRNLDQFTMEDITRLLFPAGAGPSSVAVGDLNGDGHADLVVANALTNTVSVLLGNGDGTFQAPRQFDIGAFVTPNLIVIGAPVYGRRVVIGDFNGDGIPDIAVTNFDSSDVSVLLGRGDGTFEAQRRFDATASPAAMDVGDLNGDGILDLVVADSPSTEMQTTVAVLLGRGDGTFLPQSTFTVASGSALPLTGVRLADLNGDGILDLILSGDNSPGVNIFLGTGDGGFEFLGRFDAHREAPDVAVADLDGDGHLDLVLASHHEEGEVSILFGNGDGTFQPPLNLFAGQSILGVAVVDFGRQMMDADGSLVIGPPDGQLDIVVVASGQVFATAVRQTVTLIFAEPLPAGSYVIELSPAIQAQLFNDQELALLSGSETFTGHPVVMLDGQSVIEGSRIEAAGLVQPPGLLGDLAVFEEGTRFLVQLQNDLSRLLDALLTDFSDDPRVAASLLAQIFDRLVPALGDLGVRATQLLVVFIDPPSITRLVADQGHVIYDRHTNTLQTTIANTFTYTGGNLDLIIVADAVGTYFLDLFDVPERARGGAVLLAQGFSEVIDVTADIRSGVHQFSFTFPAWHGDVFLTPPNPPQDSPTPPIPSHQDSTPPLPPGVPTPPGSPGDLTSSPSTSRSGPDAILGISDLSLLLEGSSMIAGVLQAMGLTPELALLIPVGGQSAGAADDDQDDWSPQVSDRSEPADEAGTAEIEEDEEAMPGDDGERLPEANTDEPAPDGPPPDEDAEEDAEPAMAAAAAEDFREALRIHPDVAEAYTGLGYIHACAQQSGAAQQQAAEALLRVVLAGTPGSAGRDDLLLHNVACIYGELSKTDAGREQELQDLAMTVLEQAVRQWRLAGSPEPSLLDVVRDEDAFPPSMKDRPDFRRLFVAPPKKGVRGPDGLPSRPEGTAAGGATP